MATYILLVIQLMANAHPMVSMQEFNSPNACENAANVIKSSFQTIANDKTVITTCVRKSM